MEPGPGHSLDTYGLPVPMPMHKYVGLVMEHIVYKGKVVGALLGEHLIGEKL